jgi:hypothetical protein
MTISRKSPPPLGNREELIGLLEPAYGPIGIERLFHQGFRIPFATAGRIEEIAAIDVERSGQTRDWVGHGMNDVVAERLSLANR